MGGRLLSLLAVTSPRILGYAAAFSPVSASSLPRHSASAGAKLFSGGNDMADADEVQKAKAAAAEYKSSDQDGAGPATAFDNILSGKWPSTKVHEDDVALAFREFLMCTCCVTSKCQPSLTNHLLRRHPAPGSDPYYCHTQES